jgi:hypothetical protein
MLGNPVPLGTIDEPRAARWWYAPDACVLVVLVVVALLVRWHGLPTNGVWLDDAVTVTSLKAPLSELLTVGFDHPGFTAGLMAWSRITGGSDATLAYPVLVAGALGPGLLYLALRWLGYARSIGVLLGAALVAAQTDIVYSGRIKTYTIDVLIVLGLALVIPRLARMRWRWQTGVVWFVAAILVASFSGFALLAVAAAGIVFILHPRSDFRFRAFAVGAQEVVHLGFLLAAFGGQYSYNNASLDNQWRQKWNAFVDFHLNPVRFIEDAVRHLGRVAEVYPGGPGWFAVLCGVIALVGLLIASFRGREALRARYLLVVLALAFAGSVLGKFPFGPEQLNPLVPGGRVSIWLVPVIAIGLAVVLDRVRGHGPATLRRVGFDASAYLAGVIVLALAIGGTSYGYPFPGAKPAAAFAESSLGRHDVLLMPFHADFVLASESSFPLTLHPKIEFSDPRLHLIGLQAVSGEVSKDVENASRVLVYVPEPPFNAVEGQARAALASSLLQLGLDKQRNVVFDSAHVEVWQRGEVSDADRANLRLSDLPPGWERTPAPAKPFSTALYTCLGVSSTTAGDSTVNLTGPPTNSQLSLSSEVISWSSPAALQSAYDAMTRPEAADCIDSTLSSALSTAGYPTSVTAQRVPLRAAVGNQVVAYDETVQTRDHTRTVAKGTVAFFTHGTTGVLVNGLSAGQRTFPDQLLSGLLTTMGNRAMSPTPR